ncbi:MAG TPA: hypothetical protein VG826_13510 [Pirellulales bacterium]|nr:hypothetical protein [Pirellulales bacterium]
MAVLTFEEIQIQKLFGHEAAEDEEPSRLREYYFKTATYEQVITDLPLRILVGHKGIGKSALFQVAMSEDAEAGRVAILIKPDDVVSLGVDTSDFLKTIRDWKTGMLSIITEKVVDALALGPSKSKKDIAKKIPLVDSLVAIVRERRTESSNCLLIDEFLSSRLVHVYIDDLDRGWLGRTEDVHRISALLNAIRDIGREHRGIRFRVSLRSDVYYLVRTSDESTDKIEGSVVWHSWTNHEIFLLLAKRIETYFGRSLNELVLAKRLQAELATYLDPVFESRFRGSGHWENAPMYRVLMSLIRKRPRDLVKLCTLAARRSRPRGGGKIVTEDFEEIFEEYSQGRIQDTINEFRSELPAIERLLLNMKPNRRERTTKEGYVYGTDALLKKIENVMQSGEFKFANRRVAAPKDLAAFMYKINFLTARKEVPNGIVRRYFEENRYLQNEFADFGFDWEVHPAYRWALQPDDVRKIYETLTLSADER